MPVTAVGWGRDAEVGGGSGVTVIGAAGAGGAAVGRICDGQDLTAGGFQDRGEKSHAIRQGGVGRQAGVASLLEKCDGAAKAVDDVVECV